MILTSLLSWEKGPGDEAIILSPCLKELQHQLTAFILKDS
jgi:hypothetical protein